MPDYAGAKAAMRARLDAGWTTTRKTYQNETPAAPRPPVEADPTVDDPDATKLAPWVNLEIIGSGSEIVGTGTPGNRVWHYLGNILVHVFVPVGEGQERADQYAGQIGELFRAAEFYNETPGFGVRTLSPSIDDGSTADDAGDWFRVTMSVDFTYWHRG